uniref:Uncharacterized protein n=1 Tax=Schistocephalus solidus TaxID=70667 RepID=A0A0V0JBJ6_SCHSO
MIPTRMSPANRPLPPLPDEAEAKRQQVRPRPARPPLSASPPHDRSNAVNARPPQVIATATVATAIIARPRVPRMGTWSPHSLQHQQQSRASGEILLNNSKLENLKAHEAGTGGLRESCKVQDGSLGQSTAAAPRCAATTSVVTACAPERRSWELHTLSISVRKPGEDVDDLLVKSVPTDHAYAEYLTISPQLPHSQTSTFHIAAGSDDGYTSLNNPPSEEGKEESKPPKKQPVNAKDLPRDPSHHRRTSRRRRVRVLVKRVPRPSSSSCRWSSTSDGGGTIYGGYYAPNQTLYQGPQQHHQNHHRRQHRRHHQHQHHQQQQQHKRRLEVMRTGETMVGALDGGCFGSVEATTVSCIDDLYRLRLRRASSRQRDDSKEQQWRHQQQHSARAHRMKPRRNHQSPSYITKLPGDHRAACLGRPKRETTTSVTAAPSTRQSTKTPTSPPQPPLGVDASTVPSPVSRPENISLSLAPPLHNHALFRRHRRSSSCRYHRSQRPSQVSEKTELEMAGCGEADLVYEVVHSDTETTATTTEREEDEDLQPLLAGEEGTGADVAYAKRFLYSNYSENTLPAAHGAARQTINAPTRPRRSANTVRRRPMQYDSCTMITMLVV